MSNFHTEDSRNHMHSTPPTPTHQQCACESAGKTKQISLHIICMFGRGGDNTLCIICTFRPGRGNSLYIICRCQLGRAYCLYIYIYIYIHVYIYIYISHVCFQIKAGMILRMSCARFDRGGGNMSCDLCIVRPAGTMFISYVSPGKGRNIVYISCVFQLGGGNYIYIYIYIYRKCVSIGAGNLLIYHMYVSIGGWDNYFYVTCMFQLGRGLCCVLRLMGGGRDHHTSCHAPTWRLYLLCHGSTSAGNALCIMCLNWCRENYFYIIGMSQHISYEFQVGQNVFLRIAKQSRAALCTHVCKVSVHGRIF